MTIVKSIKIFGMVFLYRLLGKRRPLFATLKITDRCNSKCKYCFFHDNKSKEMSKQDAFSIISELRSLGTQKITITGGEPLLREDIKDVIDFAKGGGMYVSLTTNGSLLPKNQDVLKSLDLLVVSLDGREKSHDKNRGEGSYKKSIDAIRLCKRNGVGVIINYVITKNNINDLDFVMDLAKKEGFGFAFNVLVGTKDPRIKEMIPTSAECRKTILNIMKKKVEGYPVLLSYKSLLGILRWEDYTKPTKSSARGRCFAGDFYCDIDTEGNMYPCTASKFVKADLGSGTGVKEGWFNLKNRLPCNRCLLTCYNNYNDILSLDIRNMFGVFRKLTHNL